MRLLHLGDLHLGKKLNDQSLIEDQEHVLNEIIDIIKDENIDGVMIAGDVYDKSNPSNDAFNLFSNFITNISKLNKKVFIISGNHDSDVKISYFSDLLIKNDIYVSKQFTGTTQKIEVSDGYGKINIHLLPFIKPGIVRYYYPNETINSYNDAYKVVIDNSDIDYNERNILIGHQFFTGSTTSESEEVTVGGLDNIDSSVVKDFDYVALGHLHMSQIVQGNDHIRYSGSIYKYSFSEINHVKKAIIVDIKEKGNISIEEVPFTFKHDLQELHGGFDKLMDHEACDDFVKIVLDDEFVPTDAFNSLSQIFPNILKLIRKMSDKEEIELKDDIDFKSEDIVDIFKKFYSLQNDQDPSDEVIKLIEGKMKEIKEGENNETN